MLCFFPDATSNILRKIGVEIFLESNAEGNLLPHITVTHRSFQCRVMHVSDASLNVICIRYIML